MSRNITVSDNKSYVSYPISTDSSIFTGYFRESYVVSEEILSNICKSLGFSYDLYHTMKKISNEAAEKLVSSMSTHSEHEEIKLLVNDEEKVVLGFSLDSLRAPLLNDDFIHRTLSLVETCDAVEVSEVHYHKDDLISSVIIMKRDPFIVEEKYQNRDSVITEYHVGVVLINDELNNTYSRLVLYVDNYPIYLPASFYNSTTSRFRRSTNSSAEALEVLVLKILDDLRDNDLYNKIYELHHRYRGNKDILTTYEEYNSVLRTMRRIPAIIEDNSYLGDLLDRFEDFENKYTKLDAQKSSYIWRCTAMSNLTIDSLIHLTIRILNDIYAPATDCYAIRELLGTYMSTDRIATEIASE